MVQWMLFYVAATVFIAVPALILHGIPQSPAGWLLLLLALPVMVLAEWLGEQIFGRNPVSRAIEARTAGQRFSWLRIGWWLCQYLAGVGVVLAVWYWIEH